MDRVLFPCLLLMCLFTLPATGANPPAAGAPIVSLEASGRQGQLQVQLTTSADATFANTQLLIDTDLDARTGHPLGGLGADLLIEGDRIFRFTGSDPTDWTWTPIGSAERTVQGPRLTVTLPTTLLNSEQVALVARTLSADYTPVDIAPKQAGLLVRIDPPARPTERAGDSNDPARDVTEVTAVQEEGAIVLTITTAAPFDFGTTLLFFDTDGRADTGFQPAADPAFGFEFLITGSSLTEHQGPDRSAWAWQTVGPVQQHLDAEGRTLTLRFNAALLGGTTVRYAVWNMSQDWQTLVDRAPDQGLYDLTLDAALLQPPTAAPTVAPAAPKANRDLPARQRVADSTSFYCYYGSGRAAELSHYDVVILHSPQMQREEIARLKALGVVTIGYITVGEDDQKRTGDGTGPGGLASWYFDRDGDNEPDRNSIWNSWYTNANDPKWRADRVKEAQRLIAEDGYDGIFLDTLDTAQLYPESADGMVQLVADLRAALPEAPIILNQGFKLFDRLAPLADGLMLESFTATFDFQSKTYMLNYPASLDAHTRNVNRNLQPVLQQYPMPIFVLDYARPDDTETIQIAADRAATFGYQFAAAPIYLDDVYVNGIVGTPNPKWLEMQATPEAMSLVLAEAANGLPAGTRLMPSSCYAGYTVAALVDGVTDRRTLHWSKSAWASSEDDGGAWLKIELPAARRGGALSLVWAIDSGVTHISQDYRIEVRRDGQWQSVAHTLGEKNAISRHPLPDTAFDAVRISQPSEGGSADRPGLMWLGQVQLDPA